MEEVFLETSGLTVFEAEGIGIALEEHKYAKDGGVGRPPHLIVSIALK